MASISPGARKSVELLTLPFSPDVEFCGYSIPHPSDPKMNLRIQTYDDVSVHDVLEKGLKDLSDLCDVVLEKFEVARSENPNGL